MAESNNQVSSGQLRDMELPKEPDLDWFSLLEDTGVVVISILLLLIVVALIRNGRWFDQSLFFAPLVLRWELYREKTRLKRDRNQSFNAAHCRPLYDWILRLQHVHNLALERKNPSLE